MHALDEQVVENMVAGVVDFAAVMVPLEDGDSNSGAGYHAIDEDEDGDDELLSHAVLSATMGPKPDAATGPRSARLIVMATS